jgi:hypothetical protein
VREGGESVTCADDLISPESDDVPEIARFMIFQTVLAFCDCPFNCAWRPLVSP